MTEASEHRVVVIGGGFGGLLAVKGLARRRGVEVTLIDRHNYHLFQPLTYQVATGGLAPGDIAMPLRHIFRGRKQVTVLLGQLTECRLDQKQVVLSADAPGGVMTVPYDTLIVAAGSDYSYFGHEEWRSVALEVKSLDSAVEVRGRILHAFEVAELDPAQEESWLTFVVVGAGPTGVEMAGQIAELAHDTLAGEFRNVDPGACRVLLVEATDRVLGAFPDPLPRRALRSLEHLRVTVMLDHRVVDVRPDAVVLEDQNGTSEIATRTIVWAAGVTASPLARMLGEASGAEVDHAGRLTVEPDLALPGHPEVLALGDMVRVREAVGGQAVVTYPGLAPVAMQQGRYAARVVAARAAGRPAPAPFRYRDKGTLATIGRARAVADIKGLRFSGFFAWVTWLFVHIFYLIGFENRVVVLLRWAFSYFTRGRGNRLITEAARIPASADASSPSSGE